MTAEFDCPPGKQNKAERLDKAMEDIVLTRGNRNYAFDIIVGLVLQLEERIEEFDALLATKIEDYGIWNHVVDGLDRDMLEMKKRIEKLEEDK